MYLSGPAPGDPNTDISHRTFDSGRFPRPASARRVTSPPTKVFSQTTGPTEYRELAGSRKLTPDQRLALVILAMWVARQPSGRESMLRTKSTAAQIGNAAIKGEQSAQAIGIALFSGDDQTLLLQKAAELVRICASTLGADVKEHAYCHGSSKAGITQSAIEQLRSFVTRLLRERPTTQEFMDDTAWWPDFTT